MWLQKINSKRNQYKQLGSWPKNKFTYNLEGIGKTVNLISEIFWWEIN